MTTTGILGFLQQDIHSVVFATVDEKGLPQTCVIDLMLVDEKGLYFLTAKGKKFHDRVVKRSYVAVSGMKGQNTRSTVAISLRESLYAYYLSQFQETQCSRGILYL